MERKKDAKASTAAIRTWPACKPESRSCTQDTYRSLAVPKTALEGSDDHILVLLLDDLRCRREYPEGGLALCWVLRLASLEEGSQQLWPCHTYSRQRMYQPACEVANHLRPCVVAPALRQHLRPCLGPSCRSLWRGTRAASRGSPPARDGSGSGRGRRSGPRRSFVVSRIGA